MEKNWKHHGFTLVELLIVMALTGILAAAIFGVMRTTMRTAGASEENMELQQNLRVAMDQVSREIRMAGFLTRRDQSAVVVAEPDRLRLRVSTTTGRVARIVEEITITGANNTEPFRVANTGMVDLLANSEKVRVVRPPAFSQPFGGLLRITSTNRTNRTIRLGDFPTLSEPVTIIPGDLIIQSTDTGPFPNTIQFCLGPAPGCGPTSTTCPPGQLCLMRVIGQGEDLTATGIASVLAAGVAADGLRFGFLLNDGRELSTLAGGDLFNVEAIRLTVAGGKPMDPQSRRELSSVTRLRNR